MVLGLAVAQTLLLTGTTLDAGDRAGSVCSEAVQLAAIVHRGGRTTLYLANRLRHRYLRATVTLTANAAAATHGATVSREILGSGDGSARNQRFTLQKPPLTWVTAPTSTGRKSTLSVRVNDVLWHEVPSLYGQPPEARCYVLRMGADGRTTIIFGDGVSGARLPTGNGNVVATYRSGIGQPGEVAAGSLSVLMSRPLGVRSVINPLAAEGAADMEALADARRNAPVTVQTLGRIVSLRDYQDFVRSFAGVGKAQATAIWSGSSQLVHVTAAAADGTPIDPAGALYRNLTQAIAASSDGLERVQVDTFEQRYFRVEATVSIDPDADAARVLDAAAAALRERFTFANRDFGQRVTSAEVMSALQGVAGVAACTLSALVKVDESGGGDGSGVAAILPAEVARWDEASKSMVAAELLLLHPTGIRLTGAGSPS
jgi:predicted phage baseplate assembly protein